MPASRISKSVSKRRKKEFAKEIKYVERQAKRGGTSFVAVDIPTSSPTYSGPGSTFTSRQATVAPTSHRMAVDEQEIYLDPSHDFESPTKSKKPRKVYIALC
jgi:hypothetical protein